MASIIDHNIKRNDSLPAISGTLDDPDGNPIDLTGASIEFVFRLTSAAQSTALSGSVVIVDAPNGEIRYDWNTGDTDTPGLYAAEFEVTFGGGTKLTVPNTTNLLLRIFDDVDGDPQT